MIVVFFHSVTKVYAVKKDSSPVGVTHISVLVTLAKVKKCEYIFSAI